MAVSHVQTTGAQSGSNATSLAKAYAGNVTSGNQLICGVYAYNNIGGSPTISAPTDTQGNVWTQIESDVDGVNSSIATFSATANATGANTVTANTGSAYIGMAIAEYSGVGSVSGHTFNAGASTAPATTAVGDASTGQLLWGFVGIPPTGIDAITAGGGFTERFNGASGMSTAGVEAEEKSVNAATAPLWSLAFSKSWLAIAVAWYAAGSAYDPSTAPPFNDPPPSRPLRRSTREFRADPGVDASPWAALLPLPVGPPTVMPPVDAPPLSLRRATRDFRADPGVDPSTWAWALSAPTPAYQLAWDQQQGLAPRQQPRAKADFAAPIFPEQQDPQVLLPAWQPEPAPLFRRPRVAIVAAGFSPSPLYLPPETQQPPWFAADAAVRVRRAPFRSDPGCDAPTPAGLEIFIALDAAPRFARRVFVAASAADAPAQPPAVDVGLIPAWQADAAPRHRPPPRLPARAAGDLAAPPPADPSLLPDWRGDDAAARFPRPPRRPPDAGDVPAAVPPDAAGLPAAWMGEAARRFVRAAFVAAPVAEPPPAWFVLPASWPTWGDSPGLSSRTPARRPGDAGDGLGWRVVAIDREPSSEAWAVQSPDARWRTPRPAGGSVAEPPSPASGVLETPWSPVDADQPRRRPFTFVAAPGPGDPWTTVSGPGVTGVIIVAGPYWIEAGDVFCAGAEAGDILGG